MGQLLAEGSVLRDATRYLEPLLDELKNGLANMDKSLGAIHSGMDSFDVCSTKSPQRIVQWKRIDGYTAFQFDDSSIQVNHGD